MSERRLTAEMRQIYLADINNALIPKEADYRLAAALHDLDLADAEITALQSSIANELEDIRLDGEAKSAEIAQLKGALRADDLRNHQAAGKAGILYVGCDTPEALADEVCKLKEELKQAQAEARREALEEAAGAVMDAAVKPEDGGMM